MKILYIGDIMADVGIELIEHVVPTLRKEEHIDLVIGQGENVSQGKGIVPEDYTRLKKAGIDFFTGGNHSFVKPEIFQSLNDPQQPIIRPANYPEGTPGLGHKYVDCLGGKVLVVSLLGQIVGRQPDVVIANPLHVIDQILDDQSKIPRLATIVNFHGDYSSEKIVIGHYLDGRVSAVVGDHWHVPTADARVLPGGTAHITDVGMSGVLDSSLGVRYDAIVKRWRDKEHNRNELEVNGPRQFNAVLIEVDVSTGLATNIRSINTIYDHA
jgi:metallophosphoesterase (TIGR00282 family)